MPADLSSMSSPDSTDELPVDPLERLRLRRSAKWRTYDPDVLPLTVAEMDFAIADPVKEALRDAVERSDTGYGAPEPVLGDALASFAERRWQWRVDPNAVYSVTDVGVGVVELLRALIRPGNTVLISPPVYPPFFQWPAEAGAQLREVPLAHNAETGWQLDLVALEEAFRQHPAAYLLCNPQNPVGRVHTRHELEALVRLARIYGVVLISDEIHAPLMLDGATFTPLLTVEGAAEVAVSLLSASKAWNLAGLKCAAIVSASPRMRALVDRIPPDARWRIGHFGVIATVAAFTDGEPWLDRCLQTLGRRRNELAELLATRLPSVSWRPPDATYLGWLDCTALGKDDQPQQLFLTQQIATEPGLRFGALGSGHVRFNFATSSEILDVATAAMSRALP